jgi:hypothetical protein
MMPGNATSCKNTTWTKNTVFAAGFFSMCLFFLFFLLAPPSAHALEKKSTNVELTGDYVLSPAKIEVELEAGETATRTILIRNRDQETVDFELDIEDFKGSTSSEKSVVLLGEDVGPYSLKDYVDPEVGEFSLEPGEEIILPVQIAIPEDAEPGGLYGSVLVKNKPDPQASGAQTISRIGSLLFVRVEGEVTEAGSLQKLSLARENRPFYTSGPFSFNLVYENTGSVHARPYGGITVYNTLGNPVQEFEIEPYFALPNSQRYRTVKWEQEVLFGRYKAVLELNRGFGENIVDTKTITFWVLPWKWIAGGLIVLFLTLLLGYFVATKLEIRVKSK